MCQKPFPLKFSQLLFVPLTSPSLTLTPVFVRYGALFRLLRSTFNLWDSKQNALLLREKHSPRGSLLHIAVSGGESKQMSNLVFFTIPTPDLKRHTGLAALNFVPSTYVIKRSLFTSVINFYSEYGTEIMDKNTII